MRDSCRGGGLVCSCRGQLEPAGVLRALPVDRVAQIAGGLAPSHKLRRSIRAQALGKLLLFVHYKWDHTPPGKHITLCPA